MMSGLSFFNATTAIPVQRISSGLHPIAMISGLGGEEEELLTTPLTGSAASFELHRARQVRSRPARARRLIWFKLQPALSVGGISPTPLTTRMPALQDIASHTAEVSEATRSGAAMSMPAPWPAAAPGDVSISVSVEAAAPGSGAAQAAEPEEAPAPVSKPPSAISRVELTIDSLRTYDLSRPIPVVVESLGERNYHAEMADLNISVSASNPSEIIITLKDRIAQVYDGLRILKHLDAEQARQLRILETYIVKTRRGWLDRR